MIKLALDALSARQGRRGLAARGAARRSRRNRSTPGAEFLELRDCPSAIGAGLVLERPAHALVATHHATPQHRQIHQSRDEASLHHGSPLKKPAKGGLLTIYVAPRGKSGPSAGRSPSRPLGSLALALKRAKTGATIYLAPGVYTQNAGMMGKSNISIVGAPNQASILAPPSGQALKIYSSSNITIQNVWFRSAGSGGIGLAVAGSSVNVANIKTDGTFGDGVVVTDYAGQPGVLNATSSQFDGSQMGDGLHLQNTGGAGSSATVSNSTFDGNGTSPNASQLSNGLVQDPGTTAKIVGSQFNGNTNSGLTASGNAQVTASGSSFSGNRKGDGAIFFGQATVTLTGNTFASNGEVVDISKGLNGIEFFGSSGSHDNYTGTAVVSGNSFVNNTAVGIFVGSAGHLTVSDNQFSGNIVGLFLDGTGASINATVVGNTISVAPNPPSSWVGIVAQGTGLTATIGGTDPNTIQNYADGSFIYEAIGGGANPGLPHVTLLTNNYLRNGQPVDPSVAVQIA
jgi:parallel beta-helix repeat protein